MNKKHLYGRTILAVDNPTRRQTHKAMTGYFQHQSSLILPSSYQGTCEGCGREKYNLKTEIYMGQEFCSDCVGKWKKGCN